jgi:lipopolysaccharide transport system ATP-binding protein
MGGIYYAHARVFDDKGLMVYHERVIPPFEVEKDSLELGVCYLDNKWEIR